MPGASRRVIAELVALVAQEANGGDPTWAAKSIAQQIPEAVARTLAARYLADRCRDDQRALTLREERKAMREQLLQELAGSGPAPQSRRRSAPVPLPPEVEARYAEEDRQREARFLASMNDAIARYTEAMRVEWTAELLNSTFARSDGALVTWGTATIEDHRERVAMFSRNVRANAEGAARHTQAIRDLEATGAPCLAELLRAAS